MALSDGSATREQVLSAEKRIRLRREALEKAAALEAARTSDEQVWTEANGTVWRYVVLDDAEVRIQKCDPATADLAVPSEIEGKPVVSLAPDSCAYLEAVESIYLPDSILSVGFSAFRECRKLQRIHFPETLPTFDSNWLRNCVSLERLELPGRLGKIDSSIFDAEGVAHWCWRQRDCTGGVPEKRLGEVGSGRRQPAADVGWQSAV